MVRIVANLPAVGAKSWIGVADQLGEELMENERFEFNQDKATKVQLQASEREGDIFGV
jgi:hypothetical protein